ncbi:TonB-dependent receptor domain-containing protein [Caulobacter mirabilis]|uniref:TonB-dependent receptor domain-containing protein n=1 Tax=Caulobacter mirabilis TaxID=69666 RepID=UPI001FE7042D|nr:TonB-dependent receptor [Caulobacter mirabilis]
MIAGLAATSIAVIPSVGFAQEGQQPQQQQPSQQAQPASDKEEKEVEALVVTGSRIKRTEFTSTSPIQVISSDGAALQGVVDTADMLQASTVAAGSPQINAMMSSAFVTDGGPGAATISLRGLGANRTLVLLNGRRAGPAGTRGGVSAFDLNVIPQSAVDRIEILKDGASSIYGSDAVAGVVNIITKTNRDSAEIEAFASQPFEQGGETYRVSGSWGKTFDRGYVSVSADYFLQKEQKVGDRDFTNCPVQYITNYTTGARSDLIDPRTGKPACRDTPWGQLWLYDFSGAAPLPVGAKLQYDYGGNLGQYIPRVPANYPTGPGPSPDGRLVAPSTWYFADYGAPGSATLGVVNMNHPFIQDSSLIPETERMTVFVQGGYDLTPNIEAYGELLLNRRSSKTNGFRQFWTYTYTSDAFGAGDPLSTGFFGDFYMSPTAITDHFDAEQQVDYGRVVGGLRGSFGDFAAGWDWDIFTQLSRSDGDYTQDVILKEAVSASEFRTASSLCAGTKLAISGRNCIDVNWLTGDFMAGKLTDAEKAFYFDRETGNTVYTQKVLEGTVSGDLWKLPAGPLGAAFGFHYRRDEINDKPGAVTLASNSWGLTGAGITKGKDTTTELFGELSVPLVKGLPGIEDLSLSLSGRWTDVKSYGDNSTYKVGLNWQITPSWRVRATRGTSFRAPALFELYLANQTGFQGQRVVDPCINWQAALDLFRISQRMADNCASAAGPGGGVPGNYIGGPTSAEIVTGGGKGTLEAETSEATTIGVIWTPSFIDLSVALDYYEIEVNDEVTRLGGANILRICYNSETFPTDPVCSQFTRNSTSKLITQVRDRYINIANQMNRGIDLTVRYEHEFDFGRFTFDSQFSWQLEDQTALFPGNTVDTNGDVGDPDFVGNLQFRFERGDWTAFWGVDMIGKASEAEDINDHNNPAGPGIPPTTRYKIQTEFTAYHSASVRKKFDTWTVTAGMANIFDEAPPALTTLNLGQYSTTGYSVLASQYDYFGRRAFLSISKRF